MNVRVMIVLAAFAAIGASLFFLTQERAELPGSCVERRMPPAWGRIVDLRMDHGWLTWVEEGMTDGQRDANVYAVPASGGERLSVATSSAVEDLPVVDDGELVFRRRAENTTTLERFDLKARTTTTIHTSQQGFAFRGYASPYALVFDDRFGLYSIAVVDTEQGSLHRLSDNVTGEAILDGNRAIWLEGRNRTARLFVAEADSAWVPRLVWEARVPAFAPDLDGDYAVIQATSALEADDWHILLIDIRTGNATKVAAPPDTTQERPHIDGHWVSAASFGPSNSANDIVAVNRSRPSESPRAYPSISLLNDVAGGRLVYIVGNSRVREIAVACLPEG